MEPQSQITQTTDTLTKDTHQTTGTTEKDDGGESADDRYDVTTVNIKAKSTGTDENVYSTKTNDDDSTKIDENDDISTKIDDNDDNSTKIDDNDDISTTTHVLYGTAHGKGSGATSDVENGVTKNKKKGKNKKDQDGEQDNGTDLDITLKGCYRYRRERRDEDFTFPINKNRGGIIRKCYRNCNGTMVGIQKQETDTDEMAAACFCLHTDELPDHRKTKERRCGRRCSLEQNLPCGGDVNDRIGLVSVFSLKAKAKEKTDIASKQHAVDSTIGIAGGCIAVLFVVTILVLIVWRKYSSRKGRRQEAEESDVYDHVDYNEIATSCSLEGSSNVLLLNRAYMSRRLDKTRHVNGSNSPCQDRERMPIPEVDENAYHRLEAPLIPDDHSYLTPRDMMIPPSYLEVMDSSPRPNGRSPTDVLPDIPGVRDALAERISGQYYIVEKQRNVPNGVPIEKINGIGIPCSESVTEVKIRGNVAEIAETEQKYVNEIVERKKNEEPDSRGKDRVVYENEVCKNTNDTTESALFSAKSEDIEKDEAGDRGEICRNSNLSEKLTEPMSETETQRTSKTIDGNNQLTSKSVAENKLCSNEVSRNEVNVDNRSPMLGDETKYILGNAKNKENGIDGHTIVAENLVKSIGECDDKCQAVDPIENAVINDGNNFTISLKQAKITRDEEEEFGKETVSASVDEFGLCDGNVGISPTDIRYENIANVDRNEHVSTERREGSGEVSETMTTV